MSGSEGAILPPRPSSHLALSGEGVEPTLPPGFPVDGLLVLGLLELSELLELLGLVSTVDPVFVFSSEGTSDPGLALATVSLLPPIHEKS